ncbi:hypothetical protein OP10G_1426 [Fimbriimonas ginsengisoli Gsoil 348]|uniref:Uncharacterized protein n=2 Tax=Fimbriimonas ginsengisoli TaxID=1005039 RepID=A0A068NT34_FIMGI|nr:hypothetical protein OP10G_1426 [Fimbriimonas ginsengisoli Gsoil 348]
MSRREDDLHADLARANLLRLRGEFAPAEQICLRVLEQFPESAAAHTLLGDIAFSQDKAAEAVEHYQIAQGLDHLAPDIPRKLEDAKVLLQVRETASTEEQLGLPPTRPIPWTAIVFALLAVFSIVGAVVVGINASSSKVAKQTNGVAAPISATDETLATAPAVKPAPSSDTKTKPPATVPETVPATISANQPPLEDRNLLQTIQQRSQEGTHLIEVTTDPRTKTATLTYSVAAQEDPRRLGAELAKATLDQNLETLSVTLRGVRDERIVYMADVPRTRYADTLVDTWSQGHPEVDAWIPYVIQNEWPTRSPDSSENPPKTP